MDSQSWKEVRIYLADQGFSIAGATAFAFSKGCSFDEAALLADAMQIEMGLTYSDSSDDSVEYVLDTGNEELANVPELAIEALLHLSKLTKHKPTLDRLDKAIGILDKNGL